MGGIRAARGPYVAWATRRLLRLRHPAAVPRGAARRRRPGDGQPVQGRHRAGRHARRCTATSATRCSASSAGCSSRARSATSTAGCAASTAQLDPRPRPADRRHGVRQRDGGPGHAERLRRARGAHHAVARRPHPRRRTCAPGGTAGGTCASCCSTARAGCSSSPASCSCRSAWSLGIALTFGPVDIGELAFDVDTLVGASAMVVIGFQAVQLGAAHQGLRDRARASCPTTVGSRGCVDVLVPGEGPGRRRRCWPLLGLVGLVASLVHWNGRSFGELDPRDSLRIVVPAATALDHELPDHLRGAVRQHPADPAPPRRPGGVPREYEPGLPVGNRLR